MPNRQPSRAGPVGVRSSGYTPGPFSTLKEFNVDAFVRWYLKELADGEVA